MLEIFIYPVSGVMKLWHMLLHDAFGMEDSRAWLISIFGLVVTVRALIAPFYWVMIRSGRTAVLMRPEKAALAEKYAKATDKESVAAHAAAEKELHQRYNYRPSAGCVPALIQIPTFLGLYQVLLRMARPSGGLEVAPDTHIGFLTADEIRSFLDARVGGVPLPAYIAMPQEQLAALGTTSGGVRDFILPFLLLAIVFTTLNMVLSITRSLQTLDWDSSLSRGLQKFIIVLAIFVPVLLLCLGLFGPVPVAVILYWFANNLWTLVQNAIAQVALARTMPLQEEHITHHRERRGVVKEALRAKRAHKWHLRRLRLRALVQPWRLGEIRRELAADREARQEAKEAEKAERKKIRKAKQAARLQLNREKRRAKKAEREGKQQQGGDGATPDDPTGAEITESTESTESTEAMESTASTAAGAEDEADQEPTPTVGRSAEPDRGVAESGVVGREPGDSDDGGQRPERQIE